MNLRSSAALLLLGSALALFPLPSILAQPGTALQEGPKVQAADTPSLVKSPSKDPEIFIGSFPLSTKMAPVVDGDTIRVDGLRPSLRLIGIDTEETFKDMGLRKLAETNWAEYQKTIYAEKDPARPPKFGTPMGEAAKTFAEEFFKGIEKVRLEYDDPTRKKGYYGRHLAHVLARKPEGYVNFNVEIVRMGYSPYFIKYGRSTRYHMAFVKAEFEARKNLRGIWAKPPQWHCYPDYAARLAWWSDRDRDQRKVSEMRKAKKDFYVLGNDADFAALTLRVGETVTVAGTLGDFQKKSRLGIQYLGHRRGMDFALVGPHDEVKNHPIRKEQGNFLLVTGKISIHRKRPQFRIDTVSFKRVSEPQTKSGTPK